MVAQQSCDIGQLFRIGPLTQDLLLGTVSHIMFDIQSRYCVYLVLIVFVFQAVD